MVGVWEEVWERHGNGTGKYRKVLNYGWKSLRGRKWRLEAWIFPKEDIHEDVPICLPS